MKENKGKGVVGDKIEEEAWVIYSSPLPICRKFMLTLKI